MERKVSVELPRIDTDALKRHQGKLVLIVNNPSTSPILGRVDSINGKEVVMNDPVLLQGRQSIDDKPLVMPLRSNWPLTQHYTQVYVGSQIPGALFALNEENSSAHWEIYGNKLANKEDYRAWQQGVGTLPTA